MRPKEIKALISLLDDNDHEVITHVKEKIISLGDSIIPVLEQEWESNFNPEVQKRIENLIHTLQFENLLSNLQKWKNNDKRELIEGMWVIATYQYPDLDIIEIEEAIDTIAYEVEQELSNQDNPYEQVKKINNILFGEMRFSANTKNFHSPSNSMINVVLQSKKGNPLTLCVVYILLARKLDLPIFGVNLPNLFVCTYYTPESQFYINAFNRGLIFSKTDIESYIDQLNLNPLDQFFEPCSNVDIITRVIRNLIVSFEKLGEKQRVAELQELLQVVIH